MSQVSTVGQRETDQENKRDARQEREIDAETDQKRRGAEHERRSKRTRERRERDAIENNAFQMTMIESGIAPPSGIRLRIIIYDNGLSENRVIIKKIGLFITLFAILRVLILK